MTSFPQLKLKQNKLGYTLDVLNKKELFSFFTPNTSEKYKKINLQEAQAVIDEYFLTIVKKYPPKQVLIEFKSLFFDYTGTEKNFSATKALSKIIFANNERYFSNTLKRSCYILINNWEIDRHHSYTIKLIQSFSELKLEKISLSFRQKRLIFWLKKFINSDHYKNLKLFLTKLESSENNHWSERYTSYLLVPQYLNKNNPKEQRKAARLLSEKLKKKFKLDLEIYTDNSSSVLSINRKNPTVLRKETLQAIKSILLIRGNFSYSNLAKIFNQKTDSISYLDFKLALQRYLTLGIFEQNMANYFSTQIAQKMKGLDQDYDEYTLDKHLLLRTCNKVFDYLTTENKEEPSELFILFISQYNPLKLVIVLLKLILICPQSRIHLETRIAALINYYKKYRSEKSQWVMNFFELFKITFAIYADRDVKYNLLKIQDDTLDNSSESVFNAYQIFSQSKEKIEQKGNFMKNGSQWSLTYS
ncbi:MAG: hypothetical protein F6K10_17455 [Moorea sp. SIO2B7]|nr:hypothetical protein [Moorena sp. SIO2B7]